MDSEDARQEFLIRTRGTVGAAEWYSNAFYIYALAAERAMWPAANVGKLCIARGKGWSEIYENAALDCLDRAEKIGESDNE